MWKCAKVLGFRRSKLYSSHKFLTTIFGLYVKKKKKKKGVATEHMLQVKLGQNDQSGTCIW